MTTRQISPPRRGRPRGCIGVLALPVTLARSVFLPQRADRIIDPQVRQAQRLRAAAGTVATAWLLYAYPVHDAAGGYAKDQLIGSLETTGLLAVAGPIALTAFVLGARAPGRRLYLRRLAGPISAFVALFVSLAITRYLVLGLGAQQLAAGAGALQPLVLLAVLFVGFGALMFAGTGVVLATRHAFRVADVHEVLAPLVSLALVWILPTIQLFQHPHPGPVPPWLRVLFQFGPPVSITVLSL